MGHRHFKVLEQSAIYVDALISHEFQISKHIQGRVRVTCISFPHAVRAKDTSSLPLNFMVICIILATGAQTPEAAESFHSGPVQD